MKAILVSCWTRNQLVHSTLGDMWLLRSQDLPQFAFCYNVLQAILWLDLSKNQVRFALFSMYDG